MGKLYKRVGQPAKKECDNCNTVWDDKNLFNDQHGYGTNSCPFCSAKWEETEIIKLSKPVLRKTIRTEQRLYKLQEQLNEIDCQSQKLESTPLSDTPSNHNETQSQLETRHQSRLNALTQQRVERVTVLGQIAEAEEKLKEEVTFIPEPEGIRLKSGQMDWDVAYANLRAYRDKR